MPDQKSMKLVEESRQRWLSEAGPRHFTNMLDEMMSMQKTFGGKFIDFDNLTTVERIKWTKELLHCMHDEEAEIRGWLPWKHWKKYEGFTINETEIKYEIIDLLHFMLDLMLVWQMTPEDVFSMYVAKNRENHNRQKGGY